MTKTELDNALRDRYVRRITELLAEEEDIYRIASNKIALPTLDDERNERYMVITFSIPKDEDFDPEQQAEDYARSLEEKRIKAEEKAEAKRKKIEADKKAREKKKAEKESAE